MRGLLAEMPYMAGFMQSAGQSFREDVRRTVVMTGVLLTLALGGVVMLLISVYTALAAQGYPAHLSALLTAGAAFLAALVLWAIDRAAAAREKENREKAPLPAQAGNALVRDIEAYTRENALPAHVLAFAIGALCTNRPDVLKTVYAILQDEQ